jgi:hypothetical protein
MLHKEVNAPTTTNSKSEEDPHHITFEVEDLYKRYYSRRYYGSLCML